MKQRGITLLAVVLIVPLILMVVVGVLFFLMLELSRYEAQSAAESAALAASQELCASRECWANARLAAAATLSRQRVQNSIGYDSRLPDLESRFVDFKDREADALTAAAKWEVPAENLAVRIERGIYHDVNPDPLITEMRFDSLETPQGSTPPQTSRGDLYDKAIPRYVIANAVQVSVERPQLTSPIPGVLSLGRFTVGTALAVTGGIAERPIVVAPIAIPLCGLLNASGDFDPIAAAKTDKLITAADRNCPDDKCGTGLSTADMAAEKMLPAFLTDLKAEDAADSIQEDPHFVCGTPWHRLTDSPTPQQAANQCSGRWDPNLRGANLQDESGPWATEYVAGKSSSNFAVWGLVGQHSWSQEQPEQKIIDALVRNVDPNLPFEQQAAQLGLAASIGDRFTMLPQGAASTDFQEALITRITNPPSSPPTMRWPTPVEAYEAFYKSEIFPSLGNLLEVNYFKRAVIPYETALGDHNDKTIHSTAGVCQNWRRADWWTTNFNFLSSRFPSNPLPVPLLGTWIAGRFNGGPLSADTWEVNIPIIADASQTQCENGLPDTHPLSVIKDFRLGVDNPDRFIIVGFVRGVVYDSAIGTSNFAGPVRAGADYDASGVGAYAGRYSYQSPKGQATCNFGRMRIKADSAFIRWSEAVKSDSGRKTQLVDN